MPFLKHHYILLFSVVSKIFAYPQPYRPPVTTITSPPVQRLTPHAVPLISATCMQFIFPVTITLFGHPTCPNPEFNITPTAIYIGSCVCHPPSSSSPGSFDQNTPTCFAVSSRIRNPSHRLIHFSYLGIQEINIVIMSRG